MPKKPGAIHSQLVPPWRCSPRGDSHTNTIENYFSILKRRLTGIYQHVSPQHLKRYVCEFDFRYNHRGLTDAERTVAAL